MVSQVIMKSLMAYALLAAISFLVAVLIKVIVGFFHRAAEQASSGVPKPVVKPVVRPVVAAGVPPHHLVAIIAATQALAGGSILRIEDVGVDKNWTAFGRSAQHSHDVRRGSV
ncbi:MAG: hypothetical protein HW380_846 [Magnetococcales bacterium]|nr:hypothetical protein [Magnetococcales bacterium]